MNIEDVINSSRALLAARPYVDRVRLFTRRGVSDPWKFPHRIGDCSIKSTSVFGGMDISVLQIVRDRSAIPIFIENLIFSENPDLAKRYEKEMGDNEAISYVEKKDLGKGMVYYTIICVSKTRCGARFSVCKELMHIYTDQVQRIRHAARMLAKAMEWRKCVDDVKKELSPESACFYHAVEVMLPWDFRHRQVCAVRGKYGQTRDCSKEIAISFMIPHSVVAHIFAESSGPKNYYGFSYQINSKINSKGGKQKT